jgi:hypothetical protein
MLEGINMRSRQPLVFAILTDICNEIGADARINLEEFLGLLRNNMGNRNSE